MLLNTTTALLLLSSSANPALPYNISDPSPRMVNHRFVFEIMHSIHELYHFKSFVFYITSRFSLLTSTEQQFFEEFWREFPLVPIMIITSTEHNHDMNGFLRMPSLIVVMTTERDDPIMEVAAKGLTGIRYSRTLFVLFPILKNVDVYESFKVFSDFRYSISSIIEWIWKRQFVNVVIVSIKDTVFLHDPYPVSRGKNVTGVWNAQELFNMNSSRRINLEGYMLETPVHLDLPRVFQIIRHHRGKPDTVELSGTSAKLFMAFVRYINGTLNDTSAHYHSMEPADLANIFTRVTENLLEISLHSFSDMHSVPEVGKSYPIGINDWCIMVPYQNRSAEHIYLQLALQHATWILVCVSVLYLSLAIWLCAPATQRDFSAALLQAICSLLCIVPTAILRTSTVRMRFVYFALFLLGFVLSNMYTSKMASYLTSAPIQQQIDTVDDVISQNLRIMVYEYEYYMLQTDTAKYPQKFLDLLLPVDGKTMTSHRDTLNTSFGYSVHTDRWRFINMQQQFLKKPAFRMSKMCQGPHFHVFPIQRDSHMSMPFQYFIMYATQHGFMNYWERAAFADALQLKYVKLLIAHDEPIPLSLEFFRSIWYVWWLGLVLSGLAFIFEAKKLDGAALK